MKVLHIMESTIGGTRRHLVDVAGGLAREGVEVHVAAAAERVSGFRRDLERARKDYRIRVYADAPHGWQNSTVPARYRPELAEAAWNETVDFFNEVFAGTWDDGRLHWQFEPDAEVAYDFSA